MKSLTRRTTTFFLSSTSSTNLSPHLLYSLNFFFHLNNLQEPQEKKLGTSHLSSFSTSSSSSSWRYDDEESRSVKVLVWWDFENCSVPTGVNAFRVAQRITSALRDNGIKGPVTITAFGDVLQLSRSYQEAFSSTGICLNHIPHVGKNCFDKSLLVDLLCWVSQNPPPAHLFLISGDRDFTNILHRLRMNNYNILLASSESVSGALCSAASIMWHWNSLVRGDSRGGKIYNQPPDGPYGSWYGHYKGPLEDPFLYMEQPTSSQAEESSESSTDSKLRPIPKALVNRIRQIVNSYPKGISITELRSELGKSNVAMDKDFFGHKKFSGLLLSLPKVLKLQFASDGQILVQSVQPKPAEHVESNLRLNTGSSSNNREGSTVVAELNGRNKAVTANVNDKSSLPAASPPKQEPPPLDPKEIKVEQILKKDNEPLGSSSFSPTHITESEDKTKTNSEENNNKPSPGTGFFNQIVNWCRSWRTTTNLHSASGQCCKEPNPMHNQSGNNELFSKATFWDAMESFIHTPKGSALISGAKTSFLVMGFSCACHSFASPPLYDNSSQVKKDPLTKELLAQQLQKDGPLVLNPLSVDDLLHLIDLLISEKKWVDECLSQTFPFKLIDSARSRSSSPLNPQDSNALSSIFLEMLSHSNLQRSSDNKTGNVDQNHTQTEVGLAESNEKPLAKSKSEILADCQKFVDEILVERPQGFNFSSFRRLFLEKYGYDVDYQKLGYQKLVTMLQMMRGVEIEGSYIMPSRENNVIGKESNSDGELSDSTRKDNDCGSLWEELGPISETSLNQNDTESRLRGNTNGEMDYNSYLSDEECSGSEGESPIIDGSEGQGKFRSEEDTSLLQILDSWYSSKDDANKGRLCDVDGLVDCSGNGLKSSCSSVVGADSTLTVSNCKQKIKPR